MKNNIELRELFVAFTVAFQNGQLEVANLIFAKLCADLHDWKRHKPKPNNLFLDRGAPGVQFHIDHGGNDPRRHSADPRYWFVVLWYEDDARLFMRVPLPRVHPMVVARAAWDASAFNGTAAEYKIPDRMLGEINLRYTLEEFLARIDSAECSWVILPGDSVKPT